MLRVTIDINGNIIEQIHAVRTKPKTKTVKEGTVCTYDIVYKGVTVDRMTGSYGCGSTLASQLLDKLRGNKKIYDMVAIVKLTEDMKNERK